MVDGDVEEPLHLLRMQIHGKDATDSRRVEQMGYNGAYYFARLKLNLDTKK